MTRTGKLPTIVALVLGAAAGVAVAGHFSRDSAISSSKPETKSVFVDTSGVCSFDYCGCFEEVSRSRMLTSSASSSASGSH
jgi:hypothetical protein